MAAWDSWCQQTAAQSGMFCKLAILGATQPPTLWGSHPSALPLDLNYLSKVCSQIDSGNLNELYGNGMFDQTEKYIFVKSVAFDNGQCAVARGRGALDKYHMLLFSGKKTIIFGVIGEQGTSPNAANYLSQVAATLANL